MMSPVNVPIAYLEIGASMAIIPIPIVANSFTGLPSDSLCMVLSGLA
jgi:hypothetical protein